MDARFGKGREKMQASMHMSYRVHSVVGKPEHEVKSMGMAEDKVE